MVSLKITLRAAALGTTVLTGVLPVTALAQTSASGRIEPNTEAAPAVAPGALGAAGFSISIDNAPVAGAAPPPLPDRVADIVAARTGVDVRYDGLGARRVLNVTTLDLRAAYRAGEAVTFRSSMNYPAFVARTEVRILDRARRGQPVVATLPIAPNGTADWAMPADGSGDYAYSLRTYDARGRFDETQPLSLTRTEGAFDTHATRGADPFAAPGEGEDRTRIRRIPVTGGMVTVSGENARPGGTVIVMGEPVPVDSQGRFAATRNLPAGDRAVTVDIDGRRFVRDVDIPRSDWFRVGIVDITAGRRHNGALNTDETYVDGRAAIYAKGVTESGWQITGSLDTGEGPIEDIFDRLNDKDPRRVIDRLSDDDDVFPTYGDDSTSYDDTPSQGRIYLRVENETTRLTWGDFKAGIDSGGLIGNTRALYGAELRYRWPEVTANGDSRLEVQLYAADPETAVQRDILRGTGGSVYFLSRRDITEGSVSLSVQNIDPDTGRVVSSRLLTEGVDYRVDHFQGVLILTGPIGSAASDGGLVTTGSGAFDQNLVIQYEYTPAAGTGDATAYGGRIEAWATDRLRLGATLMTETTPTGDQEIAGLDLRYQWSAQSFVELEVARTDGPGISRATSVDGGLSLTTTGGGLASASAYRFDSRFDLADFGLATPGYLAIYGERKEAGFSTLTEDITDDQTLWGVEGEIEATRRLTFRGYAESFRSDGGRRKDSAEINAIYALSATWDLGIGVERIDQAVPGVPARTGERTDAALRLTYKGFSDAEVYVFGQATLSRSGGLSDNDRFGAGFSTQITEKLAASGEVSDGDLGAAAAFRLTYAPTADNSYYIGYDLEATDAITGVTDTAENGTVVMGARTRNSDTLSSFVESKTDLPADRQSITNAFGVTYTPTARWTFGGSYETGDVRDRVNGDIARDAVSLSVGYADEDLVVAKLRLEFRVDDGPGVTQDRETWGLSLGYSNKVNTDWRFLANLDALFSDSADSDFRDGEYAKLRVGYAYRPVDNERLNLLFGYTFLHDLPGEDQVDANGNVDGPSQRSHVLSIAGTYDIHNRLTLGAKYGYRFSKVAARGTTAFTDNTASLAVARLDWHALHRWDVMGEVRYLRSHETGSDETGALLGVYRHVGEHFKVGLGYEWGGVSDDLTNLSYDNRGVFLNVIAKF